MKLQFIIKYIVICLIAILLYNAGMVGPVYCEESRKRKALIIANSEYSGNDRLEGVSNIGRRMSQVLTRLGFDVYLSAPCLDLTNSQMNSIFMGFINSIIEGDIVLCYFIGHGGVSNGNRLLGIDSKEIEDGIRFDDQVVKIIGEKTKAPKIYILETCRHKSVSGIGLNEPAETPANTFIAYATEPGRFAGYPSSYANAILRYITEPGMPIQEVFQHVRVQVMSLTNNIQKPTEFTSMTEAQPFYFRKPVQLKILIGEVDDRVMVYLDGNKVLETKDRDGMTATLQLRGGEHALIVKVYNHESYTGGIEGMGGHKPEGWSYRIAFVNEESGQSLGIFKDKEDRPKKKGPRHGKDFIVLTGSINVDKENGDITLLKIQQH